MNLWLIFLTGLTTGGLTCLALQGGLLATVIAAQKENGETSWKAVFLPTLLFLGAKLFIYTVLGFFLGLLGSMFQLSITSQIAIQFLVGLFMIATALRMLDVHPVFRRFVLTPPKLVFKFMRNNARTGSYFSPIILGIATVFFPCGTTQAIQIQAIGSGSPLLGMLTMFAFTLGTIPTFFVIGVLATKFSQLFDHYVQPVAATLILILGIMAVDNGLTLSGFPFTLKEFWQTATSIRTTDDVLGATVDGSSQSATITVYATGYDPNRIRVKAGIPIKVNFVTKNTQGCSRAIIFPSLGIQKILPETGTTAIELPALAKGNVPYSCSMGMFRGEIVAI